MPSSTCSEHRDEILLHFVEKRPIRKAASEHYAQCLECIKAVTLALDERSSRRTRSRHTGADAPVLPDAAKVALAHGREVLKREFGISE
jgi:hypothetical protein